MISFPSDFESCGYKNLRCPTFGHIVISSSAYLRSPPLETIRPAKDVSVVLCVTLFFLIVNYLLLIVYSSCNFLVPHFLRKNMLWIDIEISNFCCLWCVKACPYEEMLLCERLPCHENSKHYRRRKCWPEIQFRKYVAVISTMQLHVSLNRANSKMASKIWFKIAFNRDIVCNNVYFYIFGSRGIYIKNAKY